MSDSPPSLDYVLDGITWPELRRRLDAAVTVSPNGSRNLTRAAAARVLDVSAATIAYWEGTGELHWERLKDDSGHE